MIGFQAISNGLKFETNNWRGFICFQFFVAKFRKRMSPEVRINQPTSLTPFGEKKP
jgi:hypothetical protein